MQNLGDGPVRFPMPTPGDAFDAGLEGVTGVSSPFGLLRETLKILLSTSETPSTNVSSEIELLEKGAWQPMSIETNVVQQTYRFSLLHTGVEELTEELENALFEAGCDDALIGIQNGFFFADFGRTSSSFREALTSAIADVERSGQPLRLVRVEPL